MRGGKLSYSLMEIYLFKHIVHKFVKLNPFTCVQLFDMALSRGFTTTHSFFMLNEDIGLLREAHFAMESMNKYSQKQLDFTSLMLIVKPIHDHLMEAGGLISAFDGNDKRRYTEVMVDSESDDPLLSYVCIQYSENGLRTGGGKMADKVSPEHKKIMSSLSDGDHLVRYMNKPYLEKYGDASWIPVFLRNNTIADPVSGSGM
jgi:hypothetical protein